MTTDSPPALWRTGTLTLSLDIVEAAYQAEGEHDPVVRVLAFAETGKAPQVPGPLLRAPLGTVVRSHGAEPLGLRGDVRRPSTIAPSEP